MARHCCCWQMMRLRCCRCCWACPVLWLLPAAVLPAGQVAAAGGDGHWSCGRLGSEPTACEKQEMLPRPLKHASHGTFMLSWLE